MTCRACGKETHGNIFELMRCNEQIRYGTIPTPEDKKVVAKKTSKRSTVASDDAGISTSTTIATSSSDSYDSGSSSCDSGSSSSCD